MSLTSINVIFDCANFISFNVHNANSQPFPMCKELNIQINVYLVVLLQNMQWKILTKIVETLGLH
jgi:hypothetical protein